MFLLFLLFACSEYDISEVVEPNGGNDAVEDSAVVWYDSEDSGSPIYDEEVAIEKIYTNTGSSLYFYDPDLHQLEFIGEFLLGQQRIENITDIAINSNGQMFGTTSSALYQIMPTTAEVIFIRSLPKAYMGLTAYNNTSLIATGTSLDIIEIYTSETNVIIPEGIFETSGDIVALPDQLLYWTVRGVNGDQLITINKDGGIEKWKDLANISGVYGIGFANDELYGFTSNHEVILIDPETAMIKETRPLEGQWWGATTNPLVW